jgi:hypothetical protein
MVDPRAIPQPDEMTAPYWEACSRGSYELQRCRSCRRFVHFPEPECPTCHSIDLGFEPASGLGQVETFTVVHRTVAPGFAERPPYVIAWVALEDQAGLRAFGNVCGCEPDDVVIGLPVKVVFEDLPGFGAIPNFAVR